MDEVKLTRAQLKALVKQDQDVTITAVAGDHDMIYVERTKYRGNRGEGKWLKGDGKYRDSK